LFVFGVHLQTAPSLLVQGPRQKALPQMKTVFLRFWRDERGITNLEYGIVVAAIALAIFDVLVGSRFHLPNTFMHCSTAIR
jgi:Flp pilus assembly pilin Flp